MFEHVGLGHLQDYFRIIQRLLARDGLVLNHGITSSDVQSRWIGMGAGEFIDRCVFPEGELPHVSLTLKEMCSAGLEVLDVESLRRHYARDYITPGALSQQGRLDLVGSVFGAAAAVAK